MSLIRHPEERTRWCVMAELEDGGFGLLSTGPDRTSWLTKRIAQKHAREFTEMHGRVAYVEEA